MATRFCHWLFVSYLLTILAVRGQVLLNEVCADNASVASPGGTHPDYVELFNSGMSDVSLTGWSITDDPDSSAEFMFPVGTTIPAKGRLVVWFDSETNYPGIVSTNFALGDTGEQVILFEGSTRHDAVAFGPQVRDLVLCRVPDGADRWKLGIPSPGGTNSAVTLGSPSALCINELLATNSVGSDWLELFNPFSNSPVDMAGLVLTDTGPADVPAIVPNTFIESGGFVRFWCTGKTNQANALDFKISSTFGETISLYATNRSDLIDRVTFGPQTRDVSYGRLPDGGTNFFFFSPAKRLSPGAPNEWLPLTNVVVNEILTHTDPPLEDAIELLNLSDEVVDVSHWWLSNSENSPLKFRIPAGSLVDPRGFIVFYEQAGSATPGFNRSGTGAFPDFTFNSAHGDEVVITAGDASGGVTGFQVARKVPPSANGIAFTRYVKSDGGIDLVAESLRTFGHDSPLALTDFRLGTGQTNAYPLVGPLVISEIMYHPPDVVAGGVTNDNVIDEYIALSSVANQPFALFDPATPTNTWYLDGAVRFAFPTNVTVQPGQTLLLVSFSPGTNALQLSAFRTRYAVSNDVPVFGPYKGKLNNASDLIQLFKPDPVQQPPHPDAGFVPGILVEKVRYQDGEGWLVSADGTGNSLHRISLTAYGNDQVNWVATTPHPGSTTIPGVPPQITTQPLGQFVTVGATVSLDVVVIGTPPLEYQWQFEGTHLPVPATTSLVLTAVQTNQHGAYDVVITNLYGVTVGATLTLDVVLIGTPPLEYQWQFEGAPLPVPATTSLVLTAVQTNQHGAYDVVITNLYGVTTSDVAFVSVAGPPRVVDMGLVSNGMLAVGMAGRQGHVYEMAGSTDLVQWVPIATCTNVTDYETFRDPAATNFARRFYRIGLMGR